MSFISAALRSARAILSKALRPEHLPIHPTYPYLSCHARGVQHVLPIRSNTIRFDTEREWVRCLVCRDWTIRLRKIGGAA